MSRVTLTNLRDYLYGTLTADDMMWLAEELKRYVCNAERLKPYTIEELHARIAKSEQDFSEGRYLTSEELFSELDKEFHFLDKQDEEEMKDLDLQFKEAI